MNNATTLTKLNVYYGWAKLNKIRRRPAISVIYENELNAQFSERAKNTLNRLQHTIYVRKQTTDEAADGKHENRIFTEFSLFLDDKKIKGDLDYLLKINFEKDQFNVSEKERETIRKQLKGSFKRLYERGVKL